MCHLRFKHGCEGLLGNCWLIAEVKLGPKIQNAVVVSEGEEVGVGQVELRREGLQYERGMLWHKGLAWCVLVGVAR